MKKFTRVISATRLLMIKIKPILSLGGLCVLLIIFLVSGITNSLAQNTWTQKADFGGLARYSAVGFSVGDKGYIGLGDNGTFYTDLWEFDPSTGVWTQKTNFPGIGRSESVSFSIGSKGYVAVGVNATTYPYTYPQDFWEFDPLNNSWSKKADFPGQGRSSATGFAVDGKGYVAAGVDKLSGDKFYKDCWQYDPVTNAWTKKADFGGGFRSNPRGFAIGDKGYIGTGYYGGWQSDFWEYSPATNTWTRKADFGGISREWAVGFSIADKGYIGTGFHNYTWLSDFWEYDQTANNWTRKADFGGGTRAHAVGFSISNKGYIGTGEKPSSPLQKDFWEYIPEGCSGLTVYADIDGDAFGDPQSSLFIDDCVIPSGYVTDNTDCNDGVATVHPGAIEMLNGVDDNCNGLIDEGFGPDSWTQIGDFGGTVRMDAVAFTIGAKAYLGTGGIDPTMYKDFWEYNPATDVWTQKADVGGKVRSYAVGFAIGNKGYIGTGWSGIGSGYEKDFWEYDPLTNTWSKKADYPQGPISGAVGFAIGSLGYLGTGEVGGLGGARIKYFWEYNPATDHWTQKADFGGTGRANAVAFTLLDKGYIGTGGATNGCVNDFWEYNPVNDSWTRKADVGGLGRSIAAGFTIGSKGYIGCGHACYPDQKDFWEYDPLTNTWKQIADFKGTARERTASFAIGGKGYVGTGYDGTYRKDFWQYTPAAVQACSPPAGMNSVDITATTAKLDWLPEEKAVGYIVRYQVAGSDQWVMKTVKVDSKRISDLTPETKYTWQVKTFCSLTPPAQSSNWSLKQTFSTAALKISDAPTTSLDLYPNPVAESFTLDLRCTPKNNPSATIFILNSLGQIVYSSSEITGNGELRKVITMPSSSAAGWYVAKVVMSDQVLERKLLYQK